MSEERKYYVYGYIDPRTEEYFYIGKGTDDRAYDHLLPYYFYRQTYFYRKLRKMLSEGIEPEIQFISEELTNKEACQLEIELINEYGRIDLGTGCLCNLTDGGEGANRLVSEETRRKLSIAHIGHQHTETTKRRMSEAQKNLGPEVRIKRRKTLIEIRGRPVCNLHWTGRIHQVFSHLRAVENYGFRSSNVRDAIRGQIKTHKDYAWRYLTLEEIELYKDKMLS